MNTRLLRMMDRCPRTNVRRAYVPGYTNRIVCVPSRRHFDGCWTVKFPTVERGREALAMFNLNHSPGIRDTASAQARALLQAATSGR